MHTSFHVLLSNWGKRGRKEKKDGWQWGVVMVGENQLALCVCVVKTCQSLQAVGLVMMTT